MSALSPQGWEFSCVSHRSSHLCLLTIRSDSTGAAEVAFGATKTVSSWADAPYTQQCGTFEHDHNEFTAVQDAFETTCPADAAKGFVYSASSLDPAATERALRVEEGVACPPWWLPLFMGDHDPIHSGSQVAHGDVDESKPHRDFMSHQSVEHLTPADNPSHASSEPFDPVHPLSFVAKCREMTAWWTSSALLCALMFLLSAYPFHGKVPTSLPRARPVRAIPNPPHFKFRTMAAGPDAEEGG